MEKFGPFGTVALGASILVVLFSFLVGRMVGPLRRWTALSADTPEFLIAVAARAIAVGVFVLSYLIISPANYLWFLVVAVLAGLLCAFTIIRVDRARRTYIISIDEVGPDGSALMDHGRPARRNVVVGTEDEMREQALKDYQRATRQHGSLSLKRFMAGYGQSVNDPAALWPEKLLAGHAASLTAGIIYIVLSGVLALFLAALVLDVSGVI